MKLISEPSVYLLSKQSVQQAELDRFLTDHGVSWQTDSEVAAEVITETAGRVCYMSYAKPRPGGNKAYIDHIMSVGHGSVCEHAVWTFLLTGLSRSLTHELVRHRAGWAYSQLSQRYVDESVAEYVVPPDLHTEVEAGLASRLAKKRYAAGVPHGQILADTPFAKMETPELLPAFHEMAEAGERWLAAVEAAQGSYVFLSDYLTKKADTLGLQKTEARKFARQAARSVLPNATETKVTVTVNARAARHFLEQRGSRHADPEIRKLANALLEVLVKDAPNLFGDYQRALLPDGTFELTTPYRKV